MVTKGLSKGRTEVVGTEVSGRLVSEVCTIDSWMTHGPRTSGPLYQVGLETSTVIVGGRRDGSTLVLGHRLCSCPGSDWRGVGSRREEGVTVPVDTEEVSGSRVDRRQTFLKTSSFSGVTCYPSRRRTGGTEIRTSGD